MAKVTEFNVDNVQIQLKKSGFTDKEYKEIGIMDGFGNIYKGILTEQFIIPEIGQKVEIVFQEVTHLGREKPYNSIVTIKTLNKEVKAMSNKKAPTTDKYFKIKGTLFYAHIKEPDTKGKFPTNKYKVDLSVSESTKKALQELGVEVKNKGDDKGDFVVLKSSYRPTVLDPEGNILVDVPLIGNGSIATITVSLYENKAPNGGKNCLGFNTVALEKLVSYEAKLLTDE